jgi:ATP-dependent helicase/nuclease subunit A
VIIDGNMETVSVGRFASEMEEADRERDRHETRRLLYVAMTRARDRLYLSSSMKNGEIAPGRGSLADVLPESIKPLFARAAGALEGVNTLAWRGVSGTSFEFRLCDGRRSMDPAVAPAKAELASAAVDRMGPLPHDPGPLRVSVTGYLSRDELDPPGEGTAGDRLTGTLIHRLLQHGVAEVSESEAGDLLTPEERASIPDVEPFARSAVDGWRRLAAREDVARALASGERFYEVPFSYLVPGSEPPEILRGAIDCLIRRKDGSALIVELKTGRRHAAHERQLDLYVRAVEASQPGVRVERMLVYL